MQKLNEVKSAYTENIFQEDIDAQFDNDGTDWIVHHGAPPSISMLWQSLSDAKTTYAEKSGEYMDAETDEDTDGIE